MTTAPPTTSGRSAPPEPEQHVRTRERPCCGGPRSTADTRPPALRGQTDLADAHDTSTAATCTPSGTSRTVGSTQTPVLRRQGRSSNRTPCSSDRGRPRREVDVPVATVPEVVADQLVAHVGATDVTGPSHPEQRAVDAVEQVGGDLDLDDGRTGEVRGRAEPVQGTAALRTRDRCRLRAEPGDERAATDVRARSRATTARGRRRTVRSGRRPRPGASQEPGGARR